MKLKGINAISNKALSHEIHIMHYEFHNYKLCNLSSYKNIPRVLMSLSNRNKNLIYKQLIFAIDNVRFRQPLYSRVYIYFLYVYIFIPINYITITYVRHYLKISIYNHYKSLIIYIFST